MLKNSYTFKSRIWRWPTSSAGRPGDGGWHFITLEKLLSAQIRKQYPKGFVKISAEVGKSFWATSLFPHMRNKKTGEIEYLICINKKVLKAEGLFAGDEIKIKIEFK